jgi:hypothetical protein
VSPPPPKERKEGRISSSFCRGLTGEEIQRPFLARNVFLGMLTEVHLSVGCVLACRVCVSVSVFVCLAGWHSQAILQILYLPRFHVKNAHFGLLKYILQNVPGV